MRFSDDPDVCQAGKRLPEVLAPGVTRHSARYSTAGAAAHLASGPAAGRYDPLEPNGLNGGAGLVATTLVRHLGSLAPELDITLLTSEASHAELAALEAPNITRKCVVGRRGSRSIPRTLADTLLPLPVRVLLKRAYWWLKTSRNYARLTDDVRADLLLCPFTVPYFWRPGLACVSIVYDLQHLTFPEFFRAEQRLNRQQHIQDACLRSNRVVCISEYVRGTLLASVDVCAERVVTIPLGQLHEFQGAPACGVEFMGLHEGQFLLYPANFWPHKNHARLFEAFGIYRRKHPDSPLKLVCTGAPNALMRTLELAAESQLPAGSVVFAGRVSEAALASLLEACAALIYPSLYEGFGMPVLEAMAHGKPVLCGTGTSLPEVAGDAAIYFEPTDPHQIATAIEVLGDTGRVAELVQRGKQRAAAFGTGRDMAVRYLALLRQVMAAKCA